MARYLTMINNTLSTLINRLEFMKSSRKSKLEFIHLCRGELSSKAPHQRASMSENKHFF